MKIFLLEDDETLAFGIRTYLEKHGYTISHASSLREAKEIFDYGVDLIILDVNLPDGTGFDFLNIYEIEKTPVMFLTVNDSEEDIIRGLNRSDAYITKPFKLSILKAKIESILRRLDNRDEKLNYKGMVLDEKNYSLFIDGGEVDLSPKEYELLSYLFKNQGTTLTRERILEKVWDIDGNFVEDNTLSASIKRLRKKLGDYSYTVETVRGIGYRFVRD